MAAVEVERGEGDGAESVPKVPKLLCGKQEGVTYPVKVLYCGGEYEWQCP